MPSNPTNKMPIPVELNREIPFVNAVYNIIEGKDDLDAAVGILKQQEQAHGVFIHYDEFHALWGLDLIPKQPPVDATQMLALAANDWDEFIENYVEVKAYSDEIKNFETKLFHFLDDTYMVLDGSKFACDCLLTLNDGSIWTFAMGAWGEYLADWARQNLWMQHALNDYFNEVNTFYGDVVVKDYYTWATTAKAVIERKCSK
ncbi:hypothetical protein [Aliterella atlantica]|uniref:Uncharacterized protein n=1 Tax=Aliterella atlantica CENA595 TaxID=1618023 RepID=A0A0D9A1D3_9CYAN|nr:hypothetical protein [Aliterella atlantica]KJH73266.1 hypothetical protein UH38_00175 [Aliterella atlantica CENA595]